MYACHETENFSNDITNGSSPDATRDKWTFEAENLRQITIYQLMKPLKIIPHPPAVLRAALLTQVPHAHRGAAQAEVTMSLLIPHS